MNRGIARRSIFEDAKDFRYFLGLLAKEVRAGTIEVHAYSLMTNHFHLLIRSLLGRLSRAMRQVGYDYVTWFNQRYDRDGPLFRHRFRSNLIGSPGHWANVQNYIDRNAVDAGIVESPSHYVWGSAWHYDRGRAPKWLTTDCVMRLMESLMETSSPASGRYDEFVLGQAPLEHSLIVSRVQTGRHQLDPVQELASRGEGLQEWFREKALNADGFPSLPPLAEPGSVLEFLELRAFSTTNERRLLAAGALRVLCRQSFAEIGARLRTSKTTARREFLAFCRRLSGDAGFLDEITALTEEMIARLNPWRGKDGDLIRWDSILDQGRSSRGERSRPVAG